MNDAVTAACNAAHRDFPATLTRLQDLVRIPSNSFDADRAPILACAQAVAGWFRDLGAPEIRLLDLHGGNPAVVIRDHRAGPQRPTVLLYGHYDVQPPLDPALWTSPAFTPTIRQGRLYGRGASDDKAAVAIHAGAYAAWLRNGGLPVNLTVLIEGEEEIGSPHMDALLACHRDLLHADCVVVADANMLANGVPALAVSVRGLVEMVLELTALKAAVHSGSWGGPTPDPTLALCRMLAALADDHGQPRIPGLTVPEPSPELIADLPNIPHDPGILAQEMGLVDARAADLADPQQVRRRLWFSPSVSVNAIQAGPAPEKAGNAINASAKARIGLRLAPGMDAEVSHRALIDHLQTLTPPGMRLRILSSHANAGWSTPVSHPAFRAGMAALEHAFGRPPLRIGLGGSLPFLGAFSRHLDDPPILLWPVGDPRSGHHGPDESQHLDDLERQIVAMTMLLGTLPS